MSSLSSGTTRGGRSMVRVRGRGRGRGHTTVAVKSKEASRFGFNIEKDIFLLTTALSSNPWQLGKDEWNAVQSAMAEKYKSDELITTRTVIMRVNRLLEKHRNHLLKDTTGTELQITERGKLLQAIDALVAEAEATIDQEFGAESDGSEFDPELPLTNRVDASELCEFVQTLSPPSSLTQCVPVSATPSSSRRKKISDRMVADEERDGFSSVLAKDLAPEASGQRKKQAKLSTEEELIKNKQELELAKFEFDKETKRENLRLEEKKLEYEQAREARVAEENRRRDEFAQSTLAFQQSFVSLLSTIVENQNQK